MTMGLYERVAQREITPEEAANIMLLRDRVREMRWRQRHPVLAFLKALWSFFAAALLVVACQTPAILDPHDKPGECHQYTEHPCAPIGKFIGCCLNDWQCCGVQNANEPAYCEPDGTCEDTSEPPSNDFGGPRKRRTMAQRRP